MFHSSKILLMEYTVRTYRLPSKPSLDKAPDDGLLFQTELSVEVVSAKLAAVWTSCRSRIHPRRSEGECKTDVLPTGSCGKQGQQKLVWDARRPKKRRHGAFFFGRAFLWRTHF